MLVRTVMDGNHEPAYLRAELARVGQLLRPGGLIVLDDVFDWRSLNVIARELEASQETRLVQRDGRLGIWQLEGTR
jgi:predicted O-methyltransferase YrrM